MRVDLDIFTEDVEVRLGGYEDRLRDLRPAMREARDILVEGNKKNFASEGAHFGEPWPMLAFETIVRKAWQGLPREPMQATGNLARAIAGRKGKRTGASRTTARAGIAYHYARFSQAGASGGRRGRQPVRLLVGVKESDRRRIVNIVARYIGEGR